MLFILSDDEDDEDEDEDEDNDDNVDDDDDDKEWESEAESLGGWINPSLNKVWMFIVVLLLYPIIL